MFNILLCVRLARMWSNPNFSEILNDELNRFSWQSLKSTRPIAERSETLEQLHAKISADYCLKVLASSTSIEKSSDEIAVICNQVEKSLIVAKNSRLHFSSHMITLQSLLTFLMKQRYKRRLLHVHETLHVLEELKILRNELLRREGGLKESLARISHVLMATRNFQGLKVSAEIEGLAKKELRTATGKFREIIRTVIVDNDSIPRKFQVDEIVSLSNALEALGEKRLVDCFSDECCACVDSVARNSLIAIAEGAGESSHFTSVLLSLIEFFWTIWERYISLGKIINFDFPQDFLFEKISREILKVVGGARFEGSSEMLVCEIFRKIRNFHVLRPQRGLLDACNSIFASYAALLAGKLQADAVSDLQSLNFQVACMNISLRAKQLREMADELTPLESEIEKICPVIFGTAVRIALLLYGDFPNFVASEIKDDVYDSQERFIAAQRFFPIVAALQNFPGNSRPVPKNKRNNFHALERYGLVTIIEDLVNSFPRNSRRNFQVTAACIRRYVCERICQDLVCDALTRWANFTLKSATGKFSEIFLAEAKQAMAILSNQDFKISMISIVSAQCLETLGLLPPGSSNFQVDQSVDLFERELGESEEWVQVREYSKAIQSEMTIEEALEWCKGHSQLPLRLLAALISRKFPAQDLTEAFNELESFFIDFVRSNS